MTSNENNSEALVGSQAQFEALVQEKLRYAVRVALMSILEAEVEAFIRALPYERTEQRRDQRNGHYTRHLETTMGQITDLPVPRTRGGYHTQLFERYHRRRDEVDQAIGAMFVGGCTLPSNLATLPFISARGDEFWPSCVGEPIFSPVCTAQIHFHHVLAGFS
jgi:hypothetical protein